MTERILEATDLSVEFERVRFLIDPHARVEETRPCQEDSSLDGGMLDHLTIVLGLSPFERDVLVLCLYAELDSSVGDLLQAGFGCRQPSFGLALQIFPGAHWSAISPDAPLRRWRLVEMGAGETLSTTTIKLSEFVFHALLGVRSADPRLSGHVSSIRSRPLWAGSQCLSAARLVQVWSGTIDSRLPIVQLVGTAPGEARGIAAEAARDLRMHLWQIPSGAIPQRLEEVADLAVLLDRDSVVFGSALLIEADMPDPEEARRIGWLTDRSMLPIAIACREPMALQAPSVRMEIGRPTPEEQTLALAARMPQPLNGHAAELDRASSVFLLGSSDLETVAAALSAGQGIWHACRTQSRTSMDGLAQRIEPKATWDDLVLPEQTMRTLGEIAAQVAHRGRVYRDWGFADREFRGLGLSALFAGPSGTGKTLAAEVLASHLEIDLYRIDLSAVVSKYIGETEKNLRRVFDAAEGSGAILLFDEADALFGKRSDVKDSHDRYANIEVSYLLQRMEAYRGVAILTSNAKTALDPAFLRRLRFIVNFPFPDATMRERMWEKAFPPSAPIENLDFAKLARLNVTGGNIHNIALGAAFLAAEEATSIDMGRLLAAARAEIAKYDRLLNEAEVAGWVGEGRK